MLHSMENDWSERQCYRYLTMALRGFVALLRALATSTLLQACLQPATSSAAHHCTFLTDTDVQSALHPGELSMHDAKSAEECCDKCGEVADCAGAAWNGPEFHTCYLKGAGARALPTPVPGTTGCLPIQQGEESGGHRGWGVEFLVMVSAVSAVYMLVGAVSQKPGARGWHPHQQQWAALGGLVADGLALVAKGATSPKTSAVARMADGRQGHNREMRPHPGASEMSGEDRAVRGFAAAASRSTPKAKNSKKNAKGRSKPNSGRDKQSSGQDQGSPLVSDLLAGTERASGSNCPAETFRLQEQLETTGGQHQSQAKVVVRVESRPI